MTWRRRRHFLVPVLLLALAACGGSAPASHDGAPPDAKGDVEDAPAAADVPGAGDATDAGDAPSDVADAGQPYDGPPLPAWKSGTRLRARVLKVTDADDAIFESVVDRDLATGCRFVKAIDGSTRCLPASVVLYFSDDKCAMPVLHLTPGCAPPTYVSSTIDCRSSGFKVGAKVASAKVFAASSEGTCVQLAPGGKPEELYALTLMPVTAFVAAAEVRDERGGALQMRYWKSEDGGYFPNGAWDKDRSAACVAGTDDYAEHCVPAVVAPSSSIDRTFADAMCTKPVGTVGATCGAEPVSAVALTTYVSCGHMTYYAEATKLTTPPYLGFIGCMETSPQDKTFYVPGATIPIGSLPDLPTVLEGAGRLKVRRADLGMDLRIEAPATFYDAIQQEACLPEDTAKGVRCMLAGAPRVFDFSDDKCTIPVYLEAKPRSCPGPRPKVAYVDRGAACGGPPMLELYDVGAAVTPEHLYFVQFDKACVPSPNPFDPTITDAYALTPATEATAAALERVTE